MARRTPSYLIREYTPDYQACRYPNVFYTSWNLYSNAPSRRGRSQSRARVRGGASFDHDIFDLIDEPLQQSI